jgi:hypothetical protein
MNAALTTLTATIFFTCAPILLLARFCRPQRMHWWLLVLLSVAFSWLFLYLWQYFSQLRAHELLPPAVGVAPPELSYLWQGADDGDPREFALVHGWLIGILYLVPWLAMYGIANMILKRRRVTTQDAA